MKGEKETQGDTQVAGLWGGAICENGEPSVRSHWGQSNNEIGEGHVGTQDSGTLNGTFQKGVVIVGLELRKRLGMEL